MMRHSRGPHPKIIHCHSFDTQGALLLMFDHPGAHYPQWQPPAQQCHSQLLEIFGCAQCSRQLARQGVVGQYAAVPEHVFVGQM
jgi:hypothetical protein